MAEYTTQSIHICTMNDEDIYQSITTWGAIVVLGTEGNNKVELLISLLNLHYFGYISLIVLIQGSGHG